MPSSLNSIAMIEQSQGGESFGESTGNCSIYVEGDSISAAGPVEAPHVPTEPYSYGRLIAAEFSVAPTVTIAGYPGTNMTQMENRWSPGSGQVNELFNVGGLIATDVAAGKKVILSVQMGNGLIEYTSANLYTRHKLYWAQARTAGAYVIACATLPRYNPAFAPGWDTNSERTDFNALQLQDPSLVDEYCFFEGYWNQQAAAGPPTQTGNYSDGIHPTAFLYNRPFLLQSYYNAVVRILSIYRPLNTVAPSISGTAAYGSTLTGNSGTWTQATDFVYQWFRRTSAGSVTPIPGANAMTYAPVPADVDQTLKLNVCARRYGIHPWKASAYTSTVTANYGAELIVNGLGTTTTGWTEASATFAVSGGQFVLTATGIANGRFAQTTDISTTSGDWYRLSLDFALGINSPPGRVFIQNTFGGTTIATVDLPSTGTYTKVFQAVSSTTYMDFRFPSDSGPETVGSTLLFDNISVKRITT